MNFPNAIVVVIISYLAVFSSAWSGSIRNLTGTQIDLLPALMVYCGLTTSLGLLTFNAITAGLLFDSLSANPLGISILPLFIVGVIVHWNRELILRDQAYAQMVLGTMASGFTPLLTVLLLLGAGHSPLLGWGSFWQWINMTVAGGVLTPLSFWFLDRIALAINYQRAAEPSFRSDREIKRGRA